MDIEDLDKNERILKNLIGTDFAGFRIGAKIGAGGYAWVFRGTDLDLGRDVAIKVLLPRDEGYPDKLRERFEREAKLVAKLRDARSIRLLQHGECDGLLFIVFEFISGESLDLWLEKNQPMRALRVVKILEQVLESLADAHDLGIVHRDIKPGNIMLYEIAGRADQVKVLDFGIGKFVNKQMTVNLTREGGWLGTPRYMAPEQILGKGVSGQSDIYSLGLVAYELMTGEAAVKSSEAMEVVGEIVSEDDVQLPDGVAPPGLISIVNKMLRKDLGRRYATAGEVLKDLQVLTRLEDLSIEITLPKKQNSALTPDSQSWKGFIAIGLIFLFIAGAGVFFFMFPNEQSNESKENLHALIESAEKSKPSVPAAKPVEIEAVAVPAAKPVEIEAVAVPAAKPVEIEAKPVEVVVEPVKSESNPAVKAPMNYWGIK